MSAFNRTSVVHFSKRKSVFAQAEDGTTFCATDVFVRNFNTRKLVYKSIVPIVFIGCGKGSHAHVLYVATENKVVVLDINTREILACGVLYNMDNARHFVIIPTGGIAFSILSMMLVYVVRFDIKTHSLRLLTKIDLPAFSTRPVVFLEDGLTLMVPIDLWNKMLIKVTFPNLTDDALQQTSVGLDKVNSLALLPFEKNCAVVCRDKQIGIYDFGNCCMTQENLFLIDFQKCVWNDSKPTIIVSHDSKHLCAFSTRHMLVLRLTKGPTGFSFNSVLWIHCAFDISSVTFSRSSPECLLCVASTEEWRTVLYKFSFSKWKPSLAQTFSPCVKKVIFNIMCSRRVVASRRTNSRRDFPLLPWEIWLIIFNMIVYTFKCGETCKETHILELGTS